MRFIFWKTWFIKRNADRAFGPTLDDFISYTYSVGVSQFILWLLISILYFSYLLLYIHTAHIRKLIRSYPLISTTKMIRLKNAYVIPPFQFTCTIESITTKPSHTYIGKPLLVYTQKCSTKPTPLHKIKQVNQWWLAKRF